MNLLILIARVFGTLVLLLWLFYLWTPEEEQDYVDPNKIIRDKAPLVVRIPLSLVVVCAVALVGGIWGILGAVLILVLAISEYSKNR